MAPHVVAIVLAHNGLQDTLACIDSMSHVRWDRLTVMLVDNASGDGTADAVAKRPPRVLVVRHDRNLGFSEGNNSGIRRALDLGADYVFLLNNDTTVARDAIARCVRTAESCPDAGAVSPMIYFANPPTMIWYAGAQFDCRRAHSGRMLGYREIDRGQYGGIRETDRLAGAAALLPSRVLRDVGLLDAELFFLYEDVEWSLRARLAGYRLYVEPEAKVWHRVSVAVGGEHSPLIAYYGTRNHLTVCREYAPLHGPAAAARDWRILAVHLAGARRAPNPPAYFREVVNGWADGRKGRLGPHWSVKR